MKRRLYLIITGLLVLLMPATGWSQASTDHSEIAQWIKMSAHEGDIPIGTTITMANWQQYQQFMPLGMIKLFEGRYGWKMPSDVQITVGPSHVGGNLPATWVAVAAR
jgi:hypothetical protein